jgi:hypothetical protein
VATVSKIVHTWYAAATEFSCVFPYGWHKQLLYRGALGGKCVGCMRDSTRDKPCPKWWLLSGKGLIRLHHGEWHYWIGKNERSLLEVLKIGRGVGERQLLQKCSDICHRGHGGAPVCVCPASRRTYGFTRYVTKAYVSDSNQIMLAYWSVYGDFSPTLYISTKDIKILKVLFPNFP